MSAVTLSPLASAPMQAFLGNSMQVADLLAWVLAQTGPARVQLTSFSISEEFLRRLFFIKQQGLIRSLDIVLDFKATNKTLLLWNFISQVVDNCYLVDNHSKIMLISSPGWTVSAVMSQNLTRGNRYESGIICNDFTTHQSLSRQLSDLITTQSISFNDVHSRAIAGG